MWVSLIQFSSATDVTANLDAITRLVVDTTRQSRQGEDHVIVLPEGSMHDFGRPDLPLGPVAQSVDGPFVAALAALAVRVESTIVAGMFETSDDAERPFNTLVAVNPAGELVATYRKAYLYDSFGYRESDRLKPGDGRPVVVPVGDLTLGLLTCYDIRFPEAARSVVDAGADTLVVPAAWVSGSLKEDHWATLLRARAIENTVYVLGTGQSGRPYIGSSLVVDPMGVILAGLGSDEGVAQARLERDVIDRVQRRNPSLANRRLPPPGS